MKKNIALIGFMATGKTTLGKALADDLGWQFMDTDELIVQKQKKSIPEIFEMYGEEFFRNEESSIIRQVMSDAKQVVATGGGAAIREENISCLLDNAYVICLTASPKEILDRTERDTTRPLLKADDRLQKIKSLLLEREKYYAKAERHIDTDAWDVPCFLKEIKDFVNSRENK